MSDIIVLKQNHEEIHLNVTTKSVTRFVEGRECETQKIRLHDYPGIIHELLAVYLMEGYVIEGGIEFIGQASSDFFVKKTSSKSQAR